MLCVFIILNNEAFHIKCQIEILFYRFKSNIFRYFKYSSIFNSPTYHW